MYTLLCNSIIRAIITISLLFACANSHSATADHLPEPLKTNYGFALEENLFNDKQVRRIELAISTNNLIRANRIVNRILKRKNRQAPPHDNTLCQSNNTGNVLAACIITKKAGIIRVSHNRLIQQNINLLGTHINDIIVTQDGNQVANYTHTKDSNQLFTETSYIEFISHKIDSQYTDTNVYQIFSAHSELQKDSIQLVSNKRLATPQANHIDVYKPHKNTHYNRSYPFHYGWVSNDEIKLTRGSGNSVFEIPFELEQWQAVIGGTCQLDLSVNTETFTSTPANVLLQVKINTHSLSQEINHTASNQITPYSLSFACDLLQAQNSVEVTVFNHNSDNIVNSLGNIKLHYSQPLMSKTGYNLAFTSDNAYRSFNIPGFIERKVSVFRVVDNQTTKIAARVKKVDTRNFNIRIGVSDFATSDFHISSITDMHDYIVVTARPYESLLPGSADYLVISHPDFYNSDILNQHIQLRNLNHQTHSVNVDDIYAQFGHGIIDPIAIKRFIQKMHEEADTSMVLLVGDDTFDYKNHLAENRVSYMPSMYNVLQRHAPIDRDYVDFDNDTFPELGIGRWPVGSLEELGNIVEKTRLYDPQNYLKTVTIGADYMNGMGSVYASNIARNFASDWTKNMATVSSNTETAVVEARQQFIDHIDNGSALNVYFGHNFGPGGPLLNSQQISLLSNHGKPTVNIMIDSYTGYYLEDDVPTRQAKHAEQQLITKDIGSVASFAPSGLTGYGYLQRNIMSYIAALPGWTLGEIYQSAINRNESLTRSYNLFGDPALVVNPE